MTKYPCSSVRKEEVARAPMWQLLGKKLFHLKKNYLYFDMQAGGREGGKEWWEKSRSLASLDVCCVGMAGHWRTGVQETARKVSKNQNSRTCQPQERASSPSENQGSHWRAPNRTGTETSHVWRAAAVQRVNWSRVEAVCELCYKLFITDNRWRPERIYLLW